jgi:SWI/SNF-related matrix-associated actin-dependent regulator 1 of chromatin subfamily A
MELFPYQIEGAEWLSKKRFAILADEMGLGKSAQSITAADLIGARKVLVLCPAIARINWQREFKRFSNRSMTCKVIQTSQDAENLSTDILICSYDLASTIKNFSCDLLILDEAHYLKSLEAKRTIAVLGSNGLVRKAKRVWALSGTPAPNHAAEMWPILYTFGITPLKYEAFVKKFCQYYMPFPYKLAITGSKNMDELKEIIKPIILRRRKDDVMKQLPAIHYSTVIVEAGPVDLGVQSAFIKYVFPLNRTQELVDQLTREQAFVEQALDMVTPEARKTSEETSITAEQLKLLAATANSVATLRRYVGLQKLEPVAAMIKEELDANAYEKVVIFAIHRDVIEGLRQKFQKYGAVTVYGGTDPHSRQKNIDKFQNNPKCRVFIGNINAAGTAITLTSAHNVVFIEQSWVPGDNAQAAMRCHRIGQTKPVVVRFISLADSIDERICNVLKRKTKELTKIFDEVDLASLLS